MVEVKDHEEPALHAKRKPDLSCVEDKEDDSKKQKLEISDNNSSVVEDEFDADEGESDSDEEEEEEDSGSEEGDDSEQSNDKAKAKAKVIDRKGKGILVEDKGKGKLIEEEEEEDDSSDGAAQSDDDSDLSEDPLAEVDLDNILPTRTRRRVVQPGVYLANDLPEEEDSDDSDA
ncbi:hypothetical protein AAG906_023443 [Vitis piasezkii]